MPRPSTNIFILGTKEKVESRACANHPPTHVPNSILPPSTPTHPPRLYPLPPYYLAKQAVALPLNLTIAVAFGCVGPSLNTYIYNSM